MAFPFFSHTGVIRPTEEALVSLSNIEYSYGFGVYETLRVVGGTPRFEEEHLTRLMESARIIGLTHAFTPEQLSQWISELIAKNQADTCNIKLLLIGGKASEDAQLYIQCLAPLFPDKSLYRDGVDCTTYRYERPFPHAKTLNMLQSYLAYREAKKAAAYDALLLDAGGNILEGTRTNFFCIKGKALYSPPEEKILLGVTRKHVLDVAKTLGFEVVMRDIPLASIGEYDGAFITSTSSKILPIRSVGGVVLRGVPEALRELMRRFDDVLVG